MNKGVLILAGAGSFQFLLGIAAHASETPSSNSGLRADMYLTEEQPYINASIGILHNELLNNQEEEYIVLGADSSYFTGFNDGMSDVIAQLNSFGYTGVLASDLAVIESDLLAAQNTSDSLGTTYGTGKGTAYQYAIIVLNRKSFSYSALPPLVTSNVRTASVPGRSVQSSPRTAPSPAATPRSFDYR